MAVTVSGWTIENGCGTPGVKFSLVITSVSDVQAGQTKPRLPTLPPLLLPPHPNEMRLEFPQFDVSDDERFGADRGE